MIIVKWFDSYTTIKNDLNDLNAFVLVVSQLRHFRHQFHSWTFIQLQIFRTICLKFAHIFARLHQRQRKITQSFNQLTYIWLCFNRFCIRSQFTTRWFFIFDVVRQTQSIANEFKSLFDIQSFNFRRYLDLVKRKETRDNHNVFVINERQK